ncbi:MAG: T9SS type A sorting domain-containing protein [Ignavibacteria bacterium]|nr:T9SS type A sorting domain-containing protein [Ignavibacteria bacterium]
MRLILILILCISVQAQWQKLNTSGNVPHLKNASAIYDPVGNRMVVYGGRNATGLSNEMWSLNLNDNSWVRIIHSGGQGPAARYTHNAYYDPTNNTMIIWSGQGEGGILYNDVWLFSFAASQWNMIWADSNVSWAPLKRYGTASVFEPVSRKFTTFAGFTTSGRFEDTWTFDVDQHFWVERTNSVHPPKRCLHTAVYAGELGRMVIYGGQDTGPLDDIWQCALSSYTWSDITPAIKPPARFWNSMIYYGNGNILIFGGLGTTAKNDMWKFNMTTNTWQNIFQGFTLPAARWGMHTIYVPADDKMIIFGGEGDSLYKDTWQFSNINTIGIENITSEIPDEYMLEQNYPNPFNPKTNINFQIPKKDYVELNLYNSSGALAGILAAQELAAGKYSYSFNANGLPSGLYFCRLIAGNYKKTIKMILIK